MPDTNDTAALVNKLRSYADAVGYGDTGDDLLSAADCIARQAARIAALEAFAKASERACVDYMERNDTQAARIKELEAKYCGACALPDGGRDDR